MALLNYEDVKKIVDLITEDYLSMSNWSRICFELLDRAADRLRTHEVLRHGDIDRAISETLHMWIARREEARTDDLVKIFQTHGANRLADKLRSAFITNSPAKHDVRGKWFDVGDVPLNFIGREYELEKLHDLLSNSQIDQKSSNVCMARITGLGGIGKSSLARKYAYAYSKFYDGNILWINAKSPKSMDLAFHKLSIKLDLGRRTDESFQHIPQDVYEYFMHSKCLFIFDNVNDFSEIVQYCPRDLNPTSIKPYILVTSRMRDIVPARNKTLQLDVLSQEEAVQFIRSEIYNCNASVAEVLASKLGALPLALQTAVAFIRQNYIENSEAIWKYLANYDSMEKRCLSWKPLRGGEYGFTLLETWKLTLEIISKEQKCGRKAIDVINVISYLDPDCISSTLLGKVVDVMFAAEGQLETDNMVEECIKLLQQYSMITVENSIIRVHRLVQHVIRAEMEKEKEKRLLTFICSTVLDEIGVGVDGRRKRCELPEQFMVQREGVYIIKFLLKHEGLRSKALIITEQLCESFILCEMILRFGLVPAQQERSTEVQGLSRRPVKLLMDDIREAFEAGLGQMHELTLKVDAKIRATQTNLGYREKIGGY